MTSGDTARHEQPIARNKKAKDDDQDDAPTYVMEDTHQSLTKEEYEALVAGEHPKEDEKSALEEPEATQSNKNELKLKDNIAEVGGNAKKRKAAKIISEEQDNVDKQTSGTRAPVAKKTKKKTKPVKLAFGDDEEG